MTTADGATDGSGTDWSPAQWAGAAFAWLWVLVPFGWGLWQLLVKVVALFSS